VRWPVVEFAGERGGIGCEIAQRVRRRLGIDGGRRTGIAQVVPHDVMAAVRERLAERVGPGQHGRAAREQNERRRRVAEMLDAERDAIGLDRRHHASSVAMTSPDMRNEWTVGYIVNLQGRSWTGGARTAATGWVLDLPRGGSHAPHRHDRCSSGASATLTAPAYSRRAS